MNSLVSGMGHLLAWFYDFIPNYGLAIILLTITVRVAMIPLAVKQAHMMIGQRANAEKMRKIQPELKKLKEKHREDRTRLYEEQRKLYESHEINALGGLAGCLPTLLQMPIFMAMYQVLRGCKSLLGGKNCTPEYFIPDSSALHGAIQGAKATFLGMNLNFRPSGVWDRGGIVEAWPYYLLCAVMGLTMWYQTKLMTASQPAVDAQFAQTQKIMQFMPLILVFASFNFPIGLTLYWASTNVWTIGQQYLLMKKYGPNAPGLQKIPENKAGTPKTITQKVILADPSAPGKAGSTNGRRKGDLQAAPEVNVNGKVGGQGMPAAKGQKPKGSGSRKRKKKKGRR